MGLVVPVWVRANEDQINTTVPELDQIIIVLLETPIFIGGALAAFFDNTLSGESLQLNATELQLSPCNWTWDMIRDFKQCTLVWLCFE